MIDKYELLEMFEAEPRIIDEEAGIYVYKKTDGHGFTFKMYLSICESTCILTLSYKGLEYPLYDIDFHDIESITCKENKLFIHQTNSKEDIVVYFKPNYTLTFEDSLPL